MDATLLSGRLFAHLSHESDDQAGELIYTQPFSAHEIEHYGSAIEIAVKAEQKDKFNVSRLEYLLWNGSSFQAPERLFPSPAFKKDTAAYLLNHYLVFGGMTYEILFSVFDPETDRTIILMKEADRDEQ